MKNLGKLSYYYTLAAVTLLLIGSIFFLSSPFSYFQAGILFPSLFFLFINITHPENVSDSEWSARLLIIFMLIVVAGIGGYYISYQAKTSEREMIAEIEKEQTKEDTISKLTEEIALLKQELSNQNEEDPVENKDEDDLNNQQVSDLLQYLGVDDEATQSSNTTSNTIVGHVTLRASYTEADVYKDTAADSRVLGIIKSSTKYPFYESAGNWYLIEFDASQKGWVKAEYVKEEPKLQ